MALHDRPSFGNVIAPFTENEEIDEAALRRHLRYMADAGTGVFVGGPNAAEAHHLNRAERTRLWQISIDELKGQAPIYAIPLGPASTTELIDMFKEAEDLGFDGAQLYPPGEGGRASSGGGIFEAEAERFFRDVLETVRFPIFLCDYHGGEVIDSPRGQVSPGLLRRLVDEYPQIEGVTVTAEDDKTLREILDAIDGKKPVRATGGHDWFHKLELGVYGFHSAEQIVAPRLCSLIPELFHRGEMERARALSAKLQALRDIIWAYHFPRSIKPILNHLGFSVGTVRRPFLPLSAEAQREMLEKIDALDLGAIESLP
jgi:4-hydroxy-tetrahydrodipicolinate synthase